MKKLIYVAVAGLFFATCTAPESDKAKTTEAKQEAVNTAGVKYMVDTKASRVEWIGTKVSGYHTGSVNIKSGELTVSNGNITSGNFVMDMPTIAAYTGFWQWQIKRHINPAVFKKLSDKKIKKYAEVFDVSIDDLKNLQLNGD